MQDLLRFIFPLLFSFYEISRKLLKKGRRKIHFGEHIYTKKSMTEIGLLFGIFRVDVKYDAYRKPCSVQQGIPWFLFFALLLIVLAVKLSNQNRIQTKLYKSLMLHVCVLSSLKKKAGLTSLSGFLISLTYSCPLQPAS